MTIERLRKHCDALHALSPEGIHIPHWHGTKADYDQLAADMKAEKSPFARKAMRDYMARFLVVTEDDAAKHADVAGRLVTEADKLIDAINLRGPGVHPVPAGEDEDGKKTPEVIGVIAEADARRYIIKSFRELRQAIGNGGAVNVPSVAEKIAEHLGSKDVEAIGQAVELEVAAFTAERDAAKERLGAHASAHEDIGFIDARLQPAFTG